MKAEVTIYTMNGCPFCTKAKAFFEQKGITPREINIDERRDKTKEVLALNPKGSFPTMIINGRV
ncbi:MAG TPA: glutaredoxin family protein, partial [Candidatus Bilamarchaeum sp.]|nr:glutaredoxin family protein [Candidatus Bilamarchaeum sp.]